MGKKMKQIKKKTKRREREREREKRISIDTLSKKTMPAKM